MFTHALLFMWMIFIFVEGLCLACLQYLVFPFPYFLQVDKILKVIPRDRKTFLFSATMTKKVGIDWSVLVLIPSGYPLD